MDRKDLITFALEVDTINCLIGSDFNLKSKQNGNVSQLLQPFHANTWCIFLLSLVLYVACLVLLTRLRSYLIYDEEQPFTVSSSFWYAYRVLTKQDVQHSPQASMTRILLITWSIFVILMASYYGAHLSRGYTVTAFARDEWREKELNLLKSSGVSVDLNDVTSCYSTLRVDNYLKRPSGFAYPRDTNLNILFDREIKIMYQTGILHLLQDTYATFVNKMCTIVQSDQQMSLLDLSGIYTCWAVGVLAAFAIFIIELRLNRITKPKEVKPAPSEHTDNVELDVHDSNPPFPSFEIPANHSSSSFRRTVVNGRDYLVARTWEGNVRLVPVDTLSGLLYDMDLYEEV